MFEGYTCVIAIGPTGNFAQDQELRQALQQLGLTMVSRGRMYGENTFEPPIEQTLPLHRNWREATWERFKAHGISGLSDFRGFTWKQAWELFEHTYGYNDDFRTLCVAMQAAQMSFTNFNPHGIDFDNRSLWRELGLTDYASTVMRLHGLAARDIVLGFTPKELERMYGIGPKTMIEIAGLQAQLRKQ